MILAHKRTTTIKVAALLLAALLAMVVAWLNLGSTSRAADLSKFDPGNIMSDVVMSKKSTMSVQQIQNFLDSKNPCNNTNVHMATWYPHLQYSIKDGRFVCMARESFNGESAAQIIWQAAQDYSINPQVLIVLLEKEQGLVSDTWPNHVQYRTATGYGCPDTAPCDTQYFGLKNQVRLAASMFRTVLDGGWSNYPVGNTYVQYHPDARCGGTVVNVQNRATSALYRYTPYQPNASALAAGYGTGDSCGAYGNRNFYALFTDWFGTTQGYTWEPMEEPRWMELDRSLRKIDFNNGQSTDSELVLRQQIKFTDKAVFNGDTYLRTEWDFKHGINKGIRLSYLTEVPYTSIEPRWMITGQDKIHKYIPNRQTWIDTGKAYEKFPIGTIVKIVDMITINGTTSFRTEFDSQRKNNMAFIDSKLQELSTLQPLETPRFMQLKAESHSHRLDGSICQTYEIYEKIHIKGKAVHNGKEFFSANQSNISPNDLCLIDPSNLFLDPLKFADFENPRPMRLKKDARRINGYTNELVDVLKTGMVINFSTKIDINGTTYYRTAYNTTNNQPFIVPADNVGEV